MPTRPRVAISTGALRVPPTYFVLQHATLMGDAYEFEAFARVADIRDTSLAIPVHDATPVAGSFRTRSRLSLAFGSRQAAAMRTFRPALIHQHFGTWSEPAIAASRQMNVPLITTVHGYDVFTTITDNDPGAPPLGVRRRFGRWTRARSTHAAFRASARVLAVSRFLADRAIEGGADAAKVAVHFQGIDTTYFTPGSPHSGDQPPLVLFVGALSERKGPQDLLAASLALAPTHPHRLVFTGEGDLAPELRARAGSAPHVSFTGPIAREAVRDLMREARMLVLPTQESNGWREAAGLVLLEAQACGAPVIAYDSGGAPEMVSDGVTGLVVAEKDRAALEDAVRELLTLPQSEYREMSLRAHDFVLAERSLARSAEELDAHYRDVL